MYDLSYNSIYDKDHLNSKLNQILTKSNIDINIIKSFAINYYKKYWEKIKEKIDHNSIDYFSEEIPIEIFSPFLDFSSKSEIFKEIFTIIIPVNLITSSDYQNDYLQYFKKLEESNINYFSIRFLFNNTNNIKFFKKLNINYNKIKRFFILQQYSSKESINDYNYFYKELFSIKDIGNNLLYLKIANIEFEEINSFQKINNFKLLEQLDLSGFNFQNIIKLKIKNLKIVKLEKCKNITFDNNYCFNIKFLSLKNCFLPVEKELLKFKQLETLILYSDENKFRQNYSFIIDYFNLVNLLYLSCETIDFIHFKNIQKLEKLNIFSDYYNTNENEKKIIEKICATKTLKDISFYLKEISDKEISEIEGVNYSVTSMNIYWKNKKDGCILFGLQNKFPNLTNLNINLPSSYYFGKSNYKTYLEFKYNVLSTIKNIHINGGGNTNIKLYCKYEYLESFDIRIQNDIENLNEAFPFFSDKCPIIFKNLTDFKFEMDDYCLITEDKLENLCGNIDRMPQLKTFILKCTTLTINEDFKKEFFLKIKKLKLHLYYFSINKYH